MSLHATSKLTLLTGVYEATPDPLEPLPRPEVDNVNYDMVKTQVKARVSLVPGHRLTMIHPAWTQQQIRYSHLLRTSP